MPTENRSSNTDPRDVFIRLNPLGLGEAELRKDSTGFEDPRTHSDYLLFLAGYRESHIVSQQHAGPDSYPPCDYCGITPDYHPWHGSGMFDGVENRHIHACDACRGRLPLHPGQYQGEPVALPPRQDDDHFSEKLRDKADGWNACLDEITKLGPLYAHPAPADPEEVERLHVENEAFDAGMRNLACQLSAGGFNAETLTADQLLEKVQWGLTNLTGAQARLVDSLRAQLAERDALLRELADAPPAAMEFRLQQKVKAALSASAEPSAPPPQTISGHKLNCKAVDEYKPGDCSCRSTSEL
ncbi:MAG: hypothetical protein ACWA7E_06370 [Pseudomonas asiatica]